MTQSTRLSPSAWMTAGIVALCDHGPDALKAEPLARRLNTTKGSFYWHFADVPAFHAALLDHWAEVAKTLLPIALEGAALPTTRLRLMGQIIAQLHAPDWPKGTDSAMRAWAQSNPRVAQAVHEVDQARLAQIGALLADLDITNPEMARILYGASIGMIALPPHDANTHAATMGSLVDLVLALR